MLANVSAEPDLGFNDMFDPSKPLPASIRDITRIDRNEFPMVDGQQIASLNEALFWPKSEPFGSVALRLREFPPLSLAKISYVRVRVIRLNPDGDPSKVTEIKVVFDSSVAGQVHFNDVTIGHDPRL